MRVKAKSINRIGEYIAFQYVRMPKFGMERGNLVEKEGPPIPMVLIAFKDQFAIGPITDLEPVWEDVELDTVAEIAEQEEQAIEQQLNGLVLPEGVATPVEEGSEGPVEEEPDANSRSGETVTE